jgi:hypothetical protein
MIKPDVIDAMVAAGCTAHQIASVIRAEHDAGEARRAEKRATDADRQRRHRQRHAESRVTECDNALPLSPKKEIPPTPPKEKTTPIPISSVGSAGASEFDRFWADFPNKVGKRDAAKAFLGARQRTDFETILAGVRRYSAKTDDRPWCNPATFLNQDRWADDPAAPVAALPRSQAPPTHAEHVNAVLDRIIQNGKSHEHPTVDASFERRDGRGVDIPLRLVAASPRD